MFEVRNCNMTKPVATVAAVLACALVASNRAGAAATAATLVTQSHSSNAQRIDAPRPGALHIERDDAPIVLHADGDCEPQWLPTFGSQPGTSATVNALIEFDDGSGGGPALYAGGRFTAAGGVAVHYVARWDGSALSPVGQIGGVLFPDVRAFAVFDDGSGSGPALYAAGTFTIADGQTANNIAKWNGTTWMPLGTGVNGTVHDLAVHDDGSGPALYAGGAFTTAGGLPASRVAKWNGASWSPLGSGVSGGNQQVVLTLLSHDDAAWGGGGEPYLYVGGAFTNAGGATAINVARWNGESWSPVGTGIGRPVSVLAAFDDGPSAGPAIYAGTQSWVNCWCDEECCFWGDCCHDKVAVCGGCDIGFGIGNESCQSNCNLFALGPTLHAFNGATWSAMPDVTGWVRTMTVFDDGAGGGPTLFIAGDDYFGGEISSAQITKWTGAGWSSLGAGIGGTLVYALTGHDDGSGAALFVGGFFELAGGLGAKNIARWSGISDDWSALGAGFNGTVESIATFDDGSGNGPQVFAGGSFISANGVEVRFIATWDDAAALWSPVGGGMNSTVSALLVFDDGLGGGSALYAGGNFTMAGGESAVRIVKWDGEQWTPLGSGMNGAVFDLAVFDDGSGPALYAAGNFTMAGGVATNRIARWNAATQSWSPLGDGVGGQVMAMAVYDDGTGSGPALYVGGLFSTAGGSPTSAIARWNGSTWSPVGTGTNGFVRGLAVFDGGPSGEGPSLFVAGLNSAGGQSMNQIGRWDGAGWSPVGGGMNSAVRALAVFDDGRGSALFAGGDFTIAGGSPASGVARWDGESWSPLSAGTSPDVRVLKPIDERAGLGRALLVGGSFLVSEAGDSYLARWQGCLEAACALADLNCDGSVGVPDLLILLSAWGPCADCNGCPADLDGDCNVGVPDLLILLANWG